MLLYFIFELICATFPLFSAYVLKYLLDFLVIEEPNMKIAIFCILSYVLSLVILQIFNSIKIIIKDSIFKKAEHAYDCDLIEKVEKLPMSVIDSSSGKDMIDDVKYSKNAAVYLSYRMVQTSSFLYSFCVAFSTLVIFNVEFSILFLILTIPGIVLNSVFDKKAENLRQRVAPDVRKFCYYRWMLTDSQPAKDVRMYDLTDPIKERYDVEKKEYMRKNKNLDRKKVAMSILSELIKRSGEISFTIFVVIQVLNGYISIGDMSLYISFAVSASEAFQSMVGMLVIAYTRSTEQMGRFFEFMDIKCVDEKDSVRELTSFQSLSFNNVYFKYPKSDNYVLSGTSFTLNRGDKLSIVGINGSGKSTIVKLILGLYEIESGEILINGYPMSDYSIEDIRKLFSVLFQSFVKYPLTLKDNVAFSDYSRSEDDERIIDSLKQSGVYDEIQSKLENGLQSYMTRKFDDKGTELSKGQWQKIALSRVYFKNSDVVVFDEPSAALDAEAEDRIFKNFELISDNKTGIMISHRISAARMSNKIIVLDNGKIVESGTHDALVKLGGLYSKLYTLQKEKYTLKEGI